MKLLSFFIVIAAFILASGSGFAQTKEHPGKKIFMDSKCTTCHSIESQGITSKSKKSKDLSNVGAIYRANFLEKFLTKKEKVDEKMHPQPFKGSTEELNQLAEFLQTLNTGEGSTDKTTKDKSINDTTSSGKK